MSEDKDRKAERETPQTTIDADQPQRELTIEDVETEAGAEVKGGGVTVFLQSSGSGSAGVSGDAG